MRKLCMCGVSLPLVGSVFLFLFVLLCFIICFLFCGVTSLHHVRLFRLCSCFLHRFFLFSLLFMHEEARELQGKRRMDYICGD